MRLTMVINFFQTNLNLVWNLRLAKFHFFFPNQTGIGLENPTHFLGVSFPNQTGFGLEKDTEWNLAAVQWVVEEQEGGERGEEVTRWSNLCRWSRASTTLLVNQQPAPVSANFPSIPPFVWEDFVRTPTLTQSTNSSISTTALSSWGSVEQRYGWLTLTMSSNFNEFWITGEVCVPSGPRGLGSEGQSCLYKRFHIFRGNLLWAW